MNEEMQATLKRILRMSWEDIGFRWEGLTNLEKKNISPQQFEYLAKWAGFREEKVA